jgi:hypothetical protein
VKPHGVVVLDKVGGQATGLPEVKRGAGAQAVGLERLVPAFEPSRWTGGSRARFLRGSGRPGARTP